jgi:hypothetical protein
MPASKSIQPVIFGSDPTDHIHLKRSVAIPLLRAGTANISMYIA